MQLLKKNSLIPSLSYSYTAGAPYRTTKALGSLILGGYDEGLYTNTGIDYQFYSDQATDLMVGIKAISTNSSSSSSSSSRSSNLLPSGMISSFIDSSVAEIYLPMDSCRAFEKALGLEYNETLDKYPVSDELHRKLDASNPVVNFTITTAITGITTSYNISLPYSSFDLTLKYPLVANDTKYFPLRRAANSTQYVLGRTFLQEAYIIVDYERSTFALHPRLWSPTPTSKIVAIETQNTDPSPKAHMGLSGGAIAGISVSITIVVVMVILAMVWQFILVPRRRKNGKGGNGKDENQTPQDATTDKPELANPEVPTPLNMDRKASQILSELQSLATPSELSGPTVPREIEGNPIYEMMGSEGPDVSTAYHRKMSQLLNDTKNEPEK